MRVDRIIQPERVAAIIRAYLGGSLDETDAAAQAMKLAGSGDRILAGYQTRPVTAAYWALRRLTETGPGKPRHDEMRFLLDCIEGRRRYPREP